MLGLPDRFRELVMGREPEEEEKDVRISGSGMAEFSVAISAQRVFPRAVIEVDLDREKSAVYLRTVRNASGELIHIFTVVADNKFGEAFVPFTLSELGGWVVVSRMHVETFDRRKQMPVLNRRVADLMRSLQLQ